MRRNIVFIGMMGTFKTATAERVAAALRMPLVDTDAVFEQRFMPIDAYFAAHGETAFREEESRIVAEVAASGNTVISCGGGAVLRRENVDALKTRGVVVLLTASDEAIIARVGKAETRPLLKADVENNVRRIPAAACTPPAPILPSTTPIVPSTTAAPACLRRCGSTDTIRRAIYCPTRNLSCNA